ncbi:transmembrane [Cystoisospora suis]|uniref:Transmembrane n=1 Tax=Cystoisospora suis TaxID=483139 RepID=A0A2C6KNW5_9APIC|nr:transmembrane [Cystoisospora suis]
MKPSSLTIEELLREDSDEEDDDLNRLLHFHPPQKPTPASPSSSSSSSSAQRVTPPSNPLSHSSFSSAAGRRGEEISSGFQTRTFLIPEREISSSLQGEFTENGSTSDVYRRAGGGEEEEEKRREERHERRSLSYLNQGGLPEESPRKNDDLMDRVSSHHSNNEEEEKSRRFLGQRGERRDQQDERRSHPPSSLSSLHSPSSSSHTSSSIVNGGPGSSSHEGETLQGTGKKKEEGRSGRKQETAHWTASSSKPKTVEEILRDVEEEEEEEEQWLKDLLNQSQSLSRQEKEDRSLSSSLSGWRGTKERESYRNFSSEEETNDVQTFHVSSRARGEGVNTDKKSFFHGVHTPERGANFSMFAGKQRQISEKLEKDKRLLNRKGEEEESEEDERTDVSDRMIEGKGYRGRRNRRHQSSRSRSRSQRGGFLEDFSSSFSSNSDDESPPSRHFFLSSSSSCGSPRLSRDKYLSYISSSSLSSEDFSSHDTAGEVSSTSRHGDKQTAHSKRKRRFASCSSTSSPPNQWFDDRREGYDHLLSPLVLPPLPATVKSSLGLLREAPLKWMCRDSQASWCERAAYRSARLLAEQEHEELLMFGRLTSTSSSSSSSSSSSFIPSSIGRFSSEIDQDAEEKKAFLQMTFSQAGDEKKKSIKRVRKKRKKRRRRGRSPNRRQIDAISFPLEDVAVNRLGLKDVWKKNFCSKERHEEEIRNKKKKNGSNREGEEHYHAKKTGCNRSLGARNLVDRQDGDLEFGRKGREQEEEKDNDEDGEEDEEEMEKEIYCDASKMKRGTGVFDTVIQGFSSLQSLTASVGYPTCFHTCSNLLAIGTSRGFFLLFDIYSIPSSYQQASNTPPPEDTLEGVSSSSSFYPLFLPFPFSSLFASSSSSLHDDENNSSADISSSSAFLSLTLGEISATPPPPEEEGLGSAGETKGGSVTSICISPCLQFLLVGYKSGAIALYEIHTTKAQCIPLPSGCTYTSSGSRSPPASFTPSLTHGENASVPFHSQSKKQIPVLRGYQAHLLCLSKDTSLSSSPTTTTSSTTDDGGVPPSSRASSSSLTRDGLGSFSRKISKTTATSPSICCLAFLSTISSHQGGRTATGEGFVFPSGDEQTKKKTSANSHHEGDSKQEISSSTSSTAGSFMKSLGKGLSGTTTSATTTTTSSSHHSAASSSLSGGSLTARGSSWLTSSILGPSRPTAIALAADERGELSILSFQKKFLSFACERQIITGGIPSLGVILDVCLLPASPIHDVERRTSPSTSHMNRSSFSFGFREDPSMSPSTGGDRDMNASHLLGIACSQAILILTLVPHISLLYRKDLLSLTGMMRSLHPISSSSDGSKLHLSSSSSSSSIHQRQPHDSLSSRFFPTAGGGAGPSDARGVGGMKDDKKRTRDSSSSSSYINQSSCFSSSSSQKLLPDLPCICWLRGRYRSECMFPYPVLATGIEKSLRLVEILFAHEDEEEEESDGSEEHNPHDHPRHPTDHYDSDHPQHPPERRRTATSFSSSRTLPGGDLSSSTSKPPRGAGVPSDATQKSKRRRRKKKKRKSRKDSSLLKTRERREVFHFDRVIQSLAAIGDSILCIMNDAYLLGIYQLLPPLLSLSSPLEKQAIMYNSRMPFDAVPSYHDTSGYTPDSALRLVLLQQVDVSLASPIYYRFTDVSLISQLVKQQEEQARYHYRMERKTEENNQDNTPKMMRGGRKKQGSSTGLLLINASSSSSPPLDKFSDKTRRGGNEDGDPDHGNSLLSSSLLDTTWSSWRSFTGGLGKGRDNSSRVNGLDEQQEVPQSRFSNFSLWGKSAQREEGRGEMERERCEGVGGESNSSYRGGKKGERERKEEEPEEEEGRRRGSKTQYEQSPQGGEGEKKLPVFAASYSKSMCIGYSRIVSHNRLLARLSHQWRTRKGRRYEDREEEEEGDRGELRIEEEHEKEDESRGDYSHRAGGQEGHLTRRGETDGRGRIRTERRRKEEEEVYNDEYCREAAEISLVGLEGVVLIRILSWRDVVNDLLLRQRGLDALALLKSIRQGYLPPLLSFSPYSSCKDFSLSLARKAEAEVDEEAGRSRERRRRRRERGFDWMRRFSSFDKDDRLSSLACTLLHGFADQLMYKRHLYEVFFLQHYFLFHRHSSPPPSQGSKGHRTTHTTENRSTSSSQRNLLSSFYPNHPSFSSSLTKTAREDEASSSSPFLSPSFFFSFYISSSSAFYSSSSIGTILWLRVVSLYCACAFELCVSLDHLRSYLTEDLFHVFYLLPEKLFLQASDFRQDNRHTQIQGREETEVRREQEERKNGEEEEVKTKKKKKDSSSIIPSSGSSSSSSTTLSQISSSRDHEGTRTCDSSSLPSSKEDFSQPCPIYYQERIASSSSSSSESMAVSNGEKREDHFISRKSLHDADDLFNRREEEQEKKEEEEHQRRGLWRTEENKRQREEEEEKEIRSLSNSSLLPEMTRSLYFSSLCRYLLTPFSFLSMDSLSLEVSTGLFQYLEAELEKASTKQSVCTPQKGKAHSAGEDRKTTQKIKSREREGTEEEEERLEEERTEKGQEDDRKAKKRGRSGDRLRRRETDEEFLTSLLNSIRLFLGDDSVEELPLLALLFLLQKKKEKARKKKNRERRTTASGGERRDLDNSSNDSKESAPETSEDLSLRQIRRRNVEEDEDEERRERSMKPFAGLYDAVEEAKGLKASREQEVGERISSEDRKKIEERRKLSGEERRREGEDQSQALVVMEEEDDDNEIKKRETEEKKDNGEDRDTNFSILDALYVHLIQTVRQDDEEKEKKNSSNSNGLLLKNLKKARLYRHIIQLLIIRLFYRNLLQCCSSSSSLLHESRRYRGEVEEEENLLRGDGGEEEELHGSDSNAVAAIARSVDLHQLIHLVSIHRMWTGVCLINMKGFSNIQTPVELLLGDTLRVQHAIFKSYIHFLQKSFTSLSSSSSSVAADQLTIEKKETSGRLPSPRLTSTGECDAPESGRKKPCRDFQSSLGLLPVFIPTSDLQSLRSSRDLFFFLFHLFSFHAASSSYHSSSECTYPFLFHERRRSLDRDGRRRQQQGSEDQSDEEEYEDSEEDEETVLSGSYEEDQRGVYTPENCEGRRYRMKPGVYTSHDKNSSGSSYCQTKMKDVASYIYQESLCCLIQDTEDKEMISRRRRQIRERRRRKNAERDGGTLQGKESQHKKLLTGRLRCESPKATKHISTHEEDERGHVHLSSSPPPPVGSPSMLLELIEYVFRRPGLSLESLSTRLDSSFLPLSSSSSSVPFSPSHQEEKEKEEDAKRSSSLTPYSTASGLKDDDLDHENHAMKKKGEEEEERNNRRDSHLSSPPSSTVTKHTRGKGRVGGGGGGLSAFLSSSPQVFKQFLLISPFLTFRLFSSLLLSCSTTGLARSSLLPPYLSSSSSSSSSNHTGGEIKEEERETQKDYYASSSDHLQAPSQSRSSEHLSNGMTRHTSSSPLPLLPPKWVWLASLLLPAVADSLMDFVHSHQAYVSILTALREEVRRQKEDEEEGRASLAKGGLLHKGEKKEEKEAKTITIRRLVGSRGENNEPFIEGRSLDVLSVVSSLESLVREQKETMRSLHMILWQFLVMVLIALPLRVKSTTLFKELLLFLVTGTPPSLSLLLLSLSPSRSSSSSSSSFSASLSSSLPLEERKRDERNEEEDLHAFLASLLLPPSSPPPPRPRPLSPSSSSLLHTSISLLPPPPPTTTTTTATSPIFPSSSSSSLHRTLLRRDINDHEHQHMRERREFFSSSSSVTFFPSSLRSPGWGMACREKLLFTFLEEEAERAFFESGGSSFQAAKALEPYQDLREKLFAYGFYSVVALLHESRRQYDSMLACLLLLLKKSSAFPGRSSLSEEEEERKKKEEGAYSRHGREREKEEVEAGRQGLKRSEGSRRRTEEETGREKKNETRKGERCSEEERRQEEFFQGEDRNVFFLIEELVIRGEDEEEGESFPSFFKAREEKKRLSVEKREDGEEETKQRERMNEGEEEEEAMRKKKKIRDEKASSFLYYTTEEDSLKRKTMKKPRFLSHWRYAHVDHTAFLRAISRHLPELVECNSTLSARLIFGIFMYQQRRKQARQTPSRPSSSSKPPSSSSSTSSSSGKAISCAPRDLEDKQGGRTTRFSQSLEVFQNGRKEGEEDKRKREGGMVVKGGEESDFFDSPNDIINLLDSYPLLQMKLLQSLIEGDQGKEGKKGKAAAGGVGGGRNSSSYPLYQISSSSSFFTSRSEHKAFLQTQLVRYLRLLCEHNPQRVCGVLQRQECLPIAACLRVCEEYEVLDACAYLLERVGDFQGIIRLFQHSFSQGLDRLRSLFLVPTFNILPILRALLPRYPSSHALHRLVVAAHSSSHLLSLSSSYAPHSPQSIHSKKKTLKEGRLQYRGPGGLRGDASLVSQEDYLSVPASHLPQLKNEALGSSFSSSSSPMFPASCQTPHTTAVYVHSSFAYVHDDWGPGVGGGLVSSPPPFTHHQPFSGRRPPRELLDLFLFNSDKTHKEGGEEEDEVSVRSFASSSLAHAPPHCRWGDSGEHLGDGGTGSVYGKDREGGSSSYACNDKKSFTTRGEEYLSTGRRRRYYGSKKKRNQHHVYGEEEEGDEDDENGNEEERGDEISSSMMTSSGEGEVGAAGGRGRRPRKRHIWWSDIPVLHSLFQLVEAATWIGHRNTHLLHKQQLEDLWFGLLALVVQAQQSFPQLTSSGPSRQEASSLQKEREMAREGVVSEEKTDLQRKDGKQQRDVSLYVDDVKKRSLGGEGGEERLKISGEKREEVNERTKEGKERDVLRRDVDRHEDDGEKREKERRERGGSSGERTLRGLVYELVLSELLSAILHAGVMTISSLPETLKRITQTHRHAQLAVLKRPLASMLNGLSYQQELLDVYSSLANSDTSAVFSQVEATRRRAISIKVLNTGTPAGRREEGGGMVPSYTPHPSSSSFSSSSFSQQQPHQEASLVCCKCKGHILLPPPASALEAFRNYFDRHEKKKVSSTPDTNSLSKNLPSPEKTGEETQRGEQHVIASSDAGASRLLPPHEHQQQRHHLQEGRGSSEGSGAKRGEQITRGDGEESYLRKAGMSSILTSLGRGSSSTRAYYAATSRARRVGGGGGGRQPYWGGREGGGEEGQREGKSSQNNMSTQHHSQGSMAAFPCGHIYHLACLADEDGGDVPPYEAGCRVCVFVHLGLGKNSHRAHPTAS